MISADKRKETAMDVPAGKAGHFDQYTNKTHAAFAKMHRPLLDHYHLCMNALMMLEVLDQNPQCRTPKELSHILGLKSNIIYLHLNQLVEEGYLDRHTEEQDHRKITLTCTRKAKALLKRAYEVRDEYNKLMISGISQEDLEVYCRVMRKIEENIDTYLKEAT
jgi:DNA-binding MarR family transcriptional regulator